MLPLMECELAGMREAVASTFTGTAEILTNTPVSNGLGGRTDSWATSATVACAVLPAISPGDTVDGARKADDERRVIQLPVSAAVTTKNRLRTGGRTYEILSVPDDLTYLITLDLQCKRLAP